jgi:hypothetical protein
MNEINSETPITRKEVFDAAEAIVAYLENLPHNPALRKTTRVTEAGAVRIP